VLGLSPGTDLLFFGTAVTPPLASAADTEGFTTPVDETEREAVLQDTSRWCGTLAEGLSRSFTVLFDREANFALHCCSSISTKVESQIA
jgi:hypothetical protein